MHEVKQVAILGGGSFGTAIANIIAHNGYSTYLWMRNSQRAQECQEKRENSAYLPGYPLNENLTVCSDLKEVVQKSDVIFISIPSASFREVVKQVAPLIHPDTLVISTTKGIEAEGFTLMSQVLEQELKNVHIGVLSGPNFASEIIRHKLTGTVIASEDDIITETIPEILCSDTFRVYTNHDRYGVELGGALKNIYAVIAGMAGAVGVGHNSTAMLLTRSLAEMGRFAAQLGANPMTFLGLSGVGDLILTCSSDLSRNFRLGAAIAKGKKLDVALEEIGQAVEGVNTLKLVYAKAEELNVNMPLVYGLYDIMFEGKRIKDAVRSLMLGEQSSDVEYDHSQVNGASS